MKKRALVDVVVLILRLEILAPLRVSGSEIRRWHCCSRSTSGYSKAHPSIVGDWMDVAVLVWLQMTAVNLENFYWMWNQR